MMFKWFRDRREKRRNEELAAYRALDRPAPKKTVGELREELKKLSPDSISTVTDFSNRWDKGYPIANMMMVTVFKPSRSSTPEDANYIKGAWNRVIDPDAREKVRIFFGANEAEKSTITVLDLLTAITDISDDLILVHSADGDPDRFNDATGIWIEEGRVVRPMREDEEGYVKGNVAYDYPKRVRCLINGVDWSQYSFD